MKNENLIPSLIFEDKKSLPKRGGRYVSIAEKEEERRRQIEKEKEEAMKKRLAECNCNCDCDCDMYERMHCNCDSCDYCNC